MDDSQKMITHFTSNMVTSILVWNW